MARAIFWMSFAFVFYVYCGYPLLLFLQRLTGRRPVHKAYWEPFVSVVIAAHNEREHIDAKIRNCLALDYPREKFEIILSLDGPTDGTDNLARRYEGKSLTVIHWPVRMGKAATLNRAVAVARGEMIVFTDARQQINHHAVRELVANLRDDSVGAVSGELILLNGASPGTMEASDAVGLYWRYEKWIRAMESDIDSVVGATGALYAIRRDLFVPLPEDTILDDVLIPMRIALRRKRIVFEPAARAYDSVACCPEAEFERKVRTLTGNYQLLAQMPELLLPWRNPLFLQFVTHKIGRLLVPYFLVALFLSSCFLLHGLYLVLFLFQIAWYLLALAGGLPSGAIRQTRRLLPWQSGIANGGPMWKALGIPYAFVLLNWAAVVGLYSYLQRDDNALNDIWVTTSHSHIPAADRHLGRIRALWPTVK